MITTAVTLSVVIEGADLIAELRQIIRVHVAERAVAEYPASRWLGERGDTVRWVTASVSLTEVDYSRLIAAADYHDFPGWMTKREYWSYAGLDLDYLGISL